jgi:hypothetical protein
MKRIGVLGLVVAVALLMSAVAPALAQAHGAGPNTTGHGHLVAKITIEEPGKGPPTESPAHQVRSFQRTGTLGDPLVANAQLWAIIIGISDYVGTANDLRYADDDAAEVRAALIERYGYPADHIIMLLGDKDRLNYAFPSRLATRANILAAISEIAGQEIAGDEVVFYFSGHGGYSDVDVDGDGETIDEGIYVQDGQFIWDGELKAAFSAASGFDTSRIVFGFDSCMAGGMTDLAASGRIVAMASTETGYSYELGGRFRNGEFSYWVVDDGMYDGRADYVDSLPGRADVTVEEAWHWANANCVYDTPTIDDEFTNDLLLGYYGAGLPPPTGSMHIASITFSSKVAGSNLFLYTTVKVVDDATNLGVSGATVEMTLVGLGGSRSFAGNTNSAGEVKFTLVKASPEGYMATVISVTHPDYVCGGLPVSRSCTLNPDGTIIQ